MWAYLFWLQKCWVCHLILKTMPSCPGLTPMLHSTIGLTAGSVDHSLLHLRKASHGGHLHFKERTFYKSANTFNNRMWCLFLNWYHLTTLKWTDVTMDIMWLFILMTILPYMCNCIMGFSNHLKAFDLQKRKKVLVWAVSSRYNWKVWAWEVWKNRVL